MPVVSFTFDDQSVEAFDGETIAAALLRHGIVAFRQTADGTTMRGPVCGMGVCFDCRVAVALNGAAHQMLRSCITVAVSGMIVRSAPFPDIINA